MSFYKKYILFLTAAVMLTGCGEIQGMSLPYVPSPRAIVHTPSSPATGDIMITMQLVDRELDPADINVEYSTDNGQNYSSATLTSPSEALNLATDWHPGVTHSVTWDSVADNIAISGNESIIIKVTPSDIGNPAGTQGFSGTFTVNNTAYNTPPAATLSTPAGTMSGNIPINYFLTDAESNTCSIEVLYSTNNGTSWLSATMGPAGDGIAGLTSSQPGTAHVYLWDSYADGVGLSGPVSSVRVRIIPHDSFHSGTSGDTGSFTVDNSNPNVPPTVTITSGPAEGSSVSNYQVIYEWTGDDTDGTVTGYYYSFDQDPPDIWTTDTSAISEILSEGSHTFRIVAVDDQFALSTVETRTFTIISGVLEAEFSASQTGGYAPVTINFTDESTATLGITSWSWDFGDSGTSTSQNPSHQYVAEGTYTVSLTITGPGGTDTETKIDYITVSAGGSTPNAAELEVFNLSNDERQAQGVAPLTWCDGLFNCAKGHANDMCDRGYFSHINPEGEDPSARGREGHAGSYTFPPIVPDPYPGIAENIAMGQNSAAQVVEAWMNSPGHRANILNGGYTHTGVGLCNGCGTHWVVTFSTD